MESVMKKSILLFATAAVALSSSAFAGTNTNYPWSEPTLESSKTRMEVRSELEKAYKEGASVRGADYNYPAMSPKGQVGKSMSAPQVQQQAGRINAEDVFKYGA
jgi:hypothetical protein